VIPIPVRNHPATKSARSKPVGGTAQIPISGERGYLLPWRVDAQGTWIESRLQILVTGGLFCQTIQLVADPHHESGGIAPGGWAIKSLRFFESREASLACFKHLGDADQAGQFDGSGAGASNASGYDSRHICASWPIRIAVAGQATSRPSRGPAV
jgi:hypothetical protein